ncbi:MAG: efflux RND transporter permease subunit [Burkholderiaceae bacterium]|nr:MAG: efflux RND transporter permease subunit [Burkholderiaceae bacterium]
MADLEPTSGANATHRLGISGRLASYFERARITPLLALVAFLLGVFALIVTPREEDPQIDVTMADVMIPWPGASAQDVEAMVAGPAEQVLAQMQGVDHVMSVSRTGMALVTVQFKVGVPRQTAVVRLYETVGANADWLPHGLGVLPPIIKPKGVNDVPIVAITLHSDRPDMGAYELERVAHSVEAALKRVPGTRTVSTIGGPGRAVLVDVDPQRLAAVGLTLPDLRGVLESANMGLPLGHVLEANESIAVRTGPFLRDAEDVANLVVASRGGKPVYLHDVARVHEGAPPPERYVWYGAVQHAGGKHTLVEQPAVTIAVTKKAGANAIQVADAVMARAHELRGSVIASDVHLSETRNYGKSASAKATLLIEKLLFATLAVVALVFIALGRREAAIVGTAVLLTLTVTLFASWAYGFTLNRVSLFALIFSIGILVDDAIVVVENIHRHQRLDPTRSLTEIIPGAVDEVGGPTILATLTVIAALLPMAFVTGLMGPYMSPIPINASMGMLLSLAIAFTVTPWLARLWLKAAHEDTGTHAAGRDLNRWLRPLFEHVFRPLLDERRGRRNRALLGAVVAAFIVGSIALPIVGAVVLKMLPFDNKSEFQVVVDMPAGTPLEKTAATLHALGAYLATVPEVINFQAYAGTASPISFNGLVRQYDLRSGGDVGDIEVNLADKSERRLQSHAIAMRERPALQAIGARFGANVKVVEVPPGPPVLSPIVAEIYGPDAAGRRRVAKQVRQVFDRTAGVVDVDDSTIAAAPEKLLLVDRAKAAKLGVTQQAIASTLRMGLAGDAATYLHDGHSRYAVPAVIELPPDLQGSLEPLLQLTVRSTSGAQVPIRELVRVTDTLREQPIYHKDLLPVVYVVGDMAVTKDSHVDSPVYAMFAMRGPLAQLKAPDGGHVAEYFIHQPSDPYAGYALKWNGEWQITYETFRDMGLAYAVGLILIYLLVVAHFGSYLTPLIIMAPIPLTIIGVLPGHALLRAQFTATSMIGMIALAGIIVRNSILLVDFIRLRVTHGVPFKDAVIDSAITRAQPILLTALAAMIGSLFILDDPIFNGLAISLIFGIFVSTVLTLVVIPLLYYVAYRKQHESSSAAVPDGGVEPEPVPLSHPQP